MTLVLASGLPAAVLAAVLPLVAVPAWWVWTLAGALATAGLGLAWATGRRLARWLEVVARAAAAPAGAGEPPVAPLPVPELEALRGAVESAASSWRQVESDLRRQHDRMGAALGAAADPVVVLDRTGRVALVNRAAERLLGHPAAALAGRPLPPLLAAPLDGLLRAAAGGGAARGPAGEGRPGRFRLPRPDGSEVVVEPSLGRAEHADETLHTLVLRDVTERHRLEEERAEQLHQERTARTAAEALARQSAFLAEAARMLAGSLDPAPALAGLARLAAGTVADWCLVDLKDDDGALRRQAVAHGDPAREEVVRLLAGRDPELGDRSDLLRKVVVTGQPHIALEAGDGDLERLAQDADEARLLRRLGRRSLLVLPLLSRGQALGAITLARAAGEPYTAADVAVATELAQRAATALDHGRLYRLAQDAHARFAGLVEGLDAIVWEADATTLELTFVSQRAGSLLGYPVERWLSEPEFWATLIHPDDREAALARFRESARTRRDCRLEYRVVAADGRTVWLDNIVRLARHPDGSVSRLYGLMIDATERKRVEQERDRLLVSERAARAEAEAAARRSRFLAEASDLLASSLDHEAILDRVARLAVATVADCCLVQLADGRGRPRLHAASAEAAHGDIARALEALGPALDARALAPHLDRLRGGEPLLLAEVDIAWLKTLRLLDDLGPRSIMVVPMVARGRPIGSLVLVSTRPERRYGPADLALARDLAQRAAVAVDNARLYREAEEANRAKDEFLATLSHELRTPLTAMLGWVQMLRSGRLSGLEAAHALASIERNTRAQAQLINDLLDVSRVVAGKLRLDRRPLDLRLVIEHAAESVRPEAESRKLALVWTPPPAPVVVLGDAVRLEQVLLNLLGNAIKFTPEGGRIEVGLEQDDTAAAVTVSDTGQGIAPDLLPHIFESFRQAEAGSTRRHGGLGLGLAIVRHLVQLHGGAVRAESPGRAGGATFTVSLPILAEAPPAGLVEAVVESRRPGPRGELPRLDGLRVLVVDDHPDSRRYVEAVLGDCGARVAQAASVAEALAVLGVAEVDVVVTDIGMPEADGYELLARLRDLERQAGRRIPAIALTAYAAEEDRARALAAGFAAHVPKPISPPDLARVVAGAGPAGGR